VGSDLLQLILLINVFVLGIVVALAIRHFLDHGRNRNQQSNGTLSQSMKQELAEAAQKEFKVALESSGLALKNDMNTTAKELNRLLERFGSDILNEEMRLFRDNLETIRKKTENETGNTHGQIAAHQAELELDLAKRRGELQTQIESHQATLERTLQELQTTIETSLQQRQALFAQKMAEREAALDTALDSQIAKEREVLLQQIDTKLGDAVASFLLNSLGTNVDLGAQTPYLLQLLESHKDEFKQEVGDANKPSTTT
jgi:hypothetical protein